MCLCCCGNSTKDITVVHDNDNKQLINVKTCVHHYGEKAHHTVSIQRHICKDVCLVSGK